MENFRKPVRPKKKGLYFHCRDCETYKFMNSMLMDRGLTASQDPSYRFIFNYDCRGCHPDSETADDMLRFFMEDVISICDKQGPDKAIRAYSGSLKFIKPLERQIEIMSMIHATVENYQKASK